MRIEQRIWTRSGGWDRGAGGDAGLVLLFGARTLFEDPALLRKIASEYPGCVAIGSSTAGEIAGSRVLDDSLVSTAVAFEHTKLRSASVALAECRDSCDAGERLARLLPPSLSSADVSAPLVHVLVLSDGLQVNGSALVKGLVSALPSRVTLTGGLAGDASDFRSTRVFDGNLSETGLVAAVGFYGSCLHVGFGSLGGWDPFGPERLITRSQGNVLYELDGQSALSLYKQYLGEHAAGLPATGLLFPLSVRDFESGEPVVRTILAVDEARQSMTFAGDVSEGRYARLMKANFERLIDGAMGAARICQSTPGAEGATLALLISCVGRKLVLRQRVEDEVDGVREVLGKECSLAGFYSYGEISPFAPGARCELHNQTMTITTFRET